MLLGAGPEGDALLAASAIEPEDVADAVVAGLAAERFLILPHPEVAEYFRRKAGDYDRWLAGMRRLQSRVLGTRSSRVSRRRQPCSPGIGQRGGR